MKRFRACLAATVLLTLFLPAKAQMNGVVVQDSLALVDFFYSTNGPGWTTPWDLSKPVKDWSGIVISHSYTGQKERVIQIGMPTRNNMTGTLPATIGNLTELTRLSLWDNKIGGNLPGSLGDLTKLTSLDLSTNNFTGTIPASIGNLTNLQFLHFSDNQFSGPIPTTLRNLHNLLYLYLNDNNFNFEGLEEIAASLQHTVIGFYNQPKIRINKKDGLLSVTTGGTLASNIYKWYNTTKFTDTTIIGDSTFRPLEEGYYHVTVTNPKIRTNHLPDLKLYSDPIPVVKLKAYARTPYPNLITPQGAIVQYPVVYYESNVKGVAADGVSKVLITVPSYEPILFSLSSDAKGSFSTLQSQDVRSSTITAQPFNGNVHVVYYAPDGYGTDEQVYRERLQILASDNYDNKTVLSLQLYTPPVVLVHGMWSKAAVWEDGSFIKTLKARGVDNVHAADYSEYSARTYAPNNSESIYGRNAIKGAINAALTEYRADSIVATQVDVVGHSLGGLMSRSLSQQPEYAVAGNYFKGYFHKLITIGTPHRGSPLGPLLWDNRDKIIYIKTKHWPYVTPVKIAPVLQMINMPIGSVHRDFGIQSAGIASLTQTPAFKSYAITAFYLPTQILDYAALNAVVKQVFDTELDKVFASRCSDEVVLPTDVIVPLYSQQGYIDKDTLFLGVSHAEVVPLGFTETSSPAIQHKVADLLLSNDPARFSNGFPAPGLQPIDCNTTNARVAQPVTSTPAAREATYPGNRYIEINSPLPGTIIDQGQTTDLQLTYHTGNGLVPVSSTFAVEGLGVYEVTDLAAGSVTVTLPAEIAAGTHRIVLFSRDNTGNVYADTSLLVVRAAGPLDSITASPARILLDSAMRQLSVMVYGHYNQAGVTRRELISTAADGTVYAAKKGTQVITVSPNGVVRAASYGTDTLIISNNGKLVKVPVTVDPNFYYASKQNNAIHFPAIDDKLINTAPFGISATAVSGEPVSFTIVSGPASVENDIITITGPGTVTIRANSAGNVYYNNAQAVTQSFLVSGALPVRWTGFNATRINGSQVELRWETSTEQNNRGFYIERRLAGTTGFTSVGQVASNAREGNSTLPLTYSFTDQNNQTTATDYRVRQVDYDGRADYSIVRTVPGVPENTVTLVSIRPNPVVNGFTLQAPTMRGPRVATILDMQGRQLRSLTVQAGAFVPVTDLPAGAYTLVIKDAFKKGADERLKLIVGR